MAKRLPKTATRVSAYYNSAKWPIQLVITKLQISIYLKPGEYIRDRNGQNINDPYFETYADKGQLRRELSDVPVPINCLPRQAPG